MNRWIEEDRERERVKATKQGTYYREANTLYSSKFRFGILNIRSILFIECQKSTIKKE